MLRVIRVYGALREFLGQSTFQADISSPAEAIRFLVANFKGLEQHMAEQHYKVWSGPWTVDLEHLHMSTGSEVIRIAPTVAGAGAVGRILVGVALIGLTIATGGFGGAAIVGGLTWAGVVGGIGASLLLGGVAALLTPTPEANREILDPKKAESFNFSGISNVSRQGLPVPVIYGETIVGSIAVSVGADVEQVAV